MDTTSCAAAHRGGLGTAATRPGVKGERERRRKAEQTQAQTAAAQDEDGRERFLALPVAVRALASVAARGLGLAVAHLGRKRSELLEDMRCTGTPSGMLVAV